MAQRSPRGLRSVVLVGGGTAAWMAAAALARVLGSSSRDITVVEPHDGGPAHLAEGTIPNLRAFHGLLGVDERDFLRATRATFKLATRFRDWGMTGESYLHPFGAYGINIKQELFQAYWLASRREGRASALEEWSVTGLAAALGRFGAPPGTDPSALRHLSYSYHLDAKLYARFLRTYAERRGVRRIEGELADVTLDPRGQVETLRLRDGRSIGGDFFIDCSGTDALLIGQVLKIAYEDWSDWLPCDRVVTVPCATSGDLVPVTEATALQAGWEWRIPLQEGVGNGYVYSSACLSDDEAAMGLLERLPGTPLSAPSLQQLKNGRRATAWTGNCLALGSAAGFLEPLESTGLHFVQTGLARLFALFPDRDFDPAISAEYNRLTALEHERVRDFLILHYVCSKREDAPFWRDCRAASLPESLAYKRDLFGKTGRIAMLEEETFSQASWLAIYAGLEVSPARHEPIIDLLGSAAAPFRGMREAIRAAVQTLPAHAAYLQQLTNSA